MQRFGYRRNSFLCAEGHYCPHGFALSRGCPKSKVGTATLTYAGAAAACVAVRSQKTLVMHFVIIVEALRAPCSRYQARMQKVSDSPIARNKLQAPIYPINQMSMVHIRKDHVRRNIETFAPGGGFVFNTVHNIMSDVPPENIVAMFEAVDEYR